MSELSHDEAEWLLEVHAGRLPEGAADMPAATRAALIAKGLVSEQVGGLALTPVGLAEFARRAIQPVPATLRSAPIFLTIVDRPAADEAAAEEVIDEP